MTPEQQRAQYVTGIANAKAKMVQRVGKAEADKWERNAIASSHAYVYAHQAAKECMGA